MAYDPPQKLFPDEIKLAFRSKATELIGYFLLGLGIFALLSLLSWKSLDPSSSMASNEPVRNWLGSLGAKFADMNIQIIGLASIVFYSTLTFWGYLLTRKRIFSLSKSHILFLSIGVILTSLSLACIPVFAAWPLNLGFGGSIGENLIKLFGQITGKNTGLWAFLLFIITATLSYKCLIKALIMTPAQTIRSQPKFKKQQTEDEFERPPENLILAYFKHYYQNITTNLHEKLQQKQSKDPRESYYERQDAHEFQNKSQTQAYQNQQFEQEYSLPPLSETVNTAYENLETRQKQPRSLSAKPDGALNTTPIEQNHLEREAPISTTPLRKEGNSPYRAINMRQAEYQLPPLDLMADVKPSDRHPSMSTESLQENARMLESVLDDFGVRGEIINVRPGPVVTLYELEPAPGVKSSRVIGLADDIARSMSAVSARVAVVPGRNVIGIELPNLKRNNVMFRELLSSRDFTQSRDKLAIALGKTIGGDPVIADLAKMPHLLVAGTTGSGKSVAINTMILSLLYRLKPEECRLIMVDPKMLELSIYDGIPHLLTPVVTDPKKAVVALKWAVREMEERYKKMSKVGVRNIDGFNARIKEAALRGEQLTRTVQTGFDRETGEAIFENEEMDMNPIPYIVVIVDEMADLMMVAGKEIEGAIQRLAQMARAAGIHLIMATQRPSVDVITGTIKANFPTRISFQVTSKIDSRTILGEMGAEQLLGRGDMLFMQGGGRIIRVHGPFVADNEVEKVVAHLKTQGQPDYLDNVTKEEEAVDEKDDKGAVFDKGGFSAEEPTDLYDRAVQAVLRDKKPSTSYVQRRLMIGYNRAASLIERMEKEGIVSPPNHQGKREILVEDDEQVF